MANMSPRKIIDAAYVALNDAFAQGLKTSQTGFLHNSLVKKVNSTSKSEWYPFRAYIPNMKEIQDNQPLVFANIENQNFEVKNKNYYNAIAINRFEFEDNQIGTYDGIFEEMGRDAGQLPDELCGDLLNGAFDTTKTFDGAAWCGTHTIGMTSFTNLVDTAFDAASFREAIAILRSIKIKPDAESRPKTINKGNLKFTVMVHPNKEEEAEEVLKAALVNGGNTNVNMNKAELLVSNYIETDTDWFCFINSGMKPIFLQERMKPEMHQTTPQTSDTAYEKLQYEYSVIARCAALPTVPWLMVGGHVTPTT